MNYIHLYTYTVPELKKFIAHMEDNIRRNWLPKMHALWMEGIELAKSLVNNI